MNYAVLMGSGAMIHIPKKLKLNSVALVHKKTIPTEQPPLVGKTSAKLLWVEGVVWSGQ
jgi:hypothetical protein